MYAIVNTKLSKEHGTRLYYKEGCATYVVNGGKARHFRKLSTAGETLAKLATRMARYDAKRARDAGFDYYKHYALAYHRYTEEHMVVKL